MEGGDDALLTSEVEVVLSGEDEPTETVASAVASLVSSEASRFTNAGGNGSTVVVVVVLLTSDGLMVNIIRWYDGMIVR